jgi:DNA-binding SARP family transcriptional activator
MLDIETLLEFGIDCSRNGHHVQGIAYLVCARERLRSDQMHLATALDAIIQTCSRYMQAQEALHAASKRFVDADMERQAQILALEDLTQASREGIDRAPRSDSKSRPTTTSPTFCFHQPPQLPIAGFNVDQPPTSPPQNRDILPPLYFNCFGQFEVRRCSQPVSLCSSRSGQSILRYLAVQPGHSASCDALMALLWPEDDPEAAQPKLHSAISALRRSLNQGCTCNPGSGYIVCKNRIYCLNPAVVIQTDVEEFLQCYEMDPQASENRIDLYEKACSLYTGPFLSEDLYADWSFLQREYLSRVYLTMCRALSDHYLKTKRYDDAAKWATAILKVNRCDEEAHRQLIEVHAARGHRIQALQQYQRCESILREELGVAPLPETTQVLQKLLTNAPFSADPEKIQRKFSENTAPHDTLLP